MTKLTEIKREVMECISTLNKGSSNSEHTIMFHVIRIIKKEILEAIAYTSTQQTVNHLMDRLEELTKFQKENGLLPLMPRKSIYLKSLSRINERLNYLEHSMLVDQYYAPPEVMKELDDEIRELRLLLETKLIQNTDEGTL